MSTKILRPFFSYYGSKWGLAQRGAFPAPKHDLVVEPFAGAAGYSLAHHDRGVLLCDCDPVIIGIWEFLIRATPEEVLAIPADASEAVRSTAGAVRDLVGFWLGRGRASPARTPSAWQRSGKWPGSFWGERTRDRIASQVECIRHWRVVNHGYDVLDNKEATWFIDPPYQGRAGRHYRTRGSAHLDYDALAAWCRSRRGQVIVCEAEGAEWLPFRANGTIKSIQKQTHREAVWTRA